MLFIAITDEGSGRLSKCLTQKKVVNLFGLV